MPGDGEVTINGAAAHLVHPGDLVIVPAFELISEEAVATHCARVVRVDATNRIIEQAAHPAVRGRRAAAPGRGRRCPGESDAAS